MTLEEAGQCSESEFFCTLEAISDDNLPDEDLTYEFFKNAVVGAQANEISCLLTRSIASLLSGNRNEFGEDSLVEDLIFQAIYHYGLEFGRLVAEEAGDPDAVNRIL